MMKAPFLTGLALNLAVASLCPGAQDREVAKERLFLMSAAQLQLGEIVLGQIAAKQAGSSRVKEFGRRIVADHSRANDQIAELAKAEDVQLPRRMSTLHKEKSEQLARLSGQEFDQAYLDYLSTYHNQALREFAENARRIKDSKVKQWAEETLAIWQDHVKMVDDMNGRVNTDHTARRP